MSVPSPLSRALLCAVSLAVMAGVTAGELSVPIQLDHAFIRQALLDQVYLGAGHTAHVLEDARQCNTLVLSDPQVDARDGRLRVVTAIEARGGTPLGDRCIGLFSWSGLVETLEEVFVVAGRPAIGVRVVDSNFLGADGVKRAVPGLLWDWLKRYVHPRRESFGIDLMPAILEARSLLRTAVPADDTTVQAVIDSISVGSVQVNDTALVVGLALSVPEPPPGYVRTAQPPLSVEELRAWDVAWQDWDAFLTWLVKQLAQEATAHEARMELRELLLDARYELRAALAADDPQPDPVRALFLRSWPRLAALVRRLGDTVPGTTAARYLSFVAAADALLAVDAAGPQLGIRVDRGGLRQLARIVAPSLIDAELEYRQDVDAKLRELMGFGPPLAPTDPAPSAALRMLDWFIAAAWARQAPAPEVVGRLTGWVPGQDELDEYLVIMGTLLTQTTDSSVAAGKVPADLAAVYRALVFATAWQETCWRQFVRVAGKVQPIRSAAGSVGLMQINQHVWRGLYDVDALAADVGYNARAGNEILLHYLVDYAIRKGEHERTGDVDNLARATYAVYNGGPRHLTRYREADTSKALRAIDAAFWSKYRRIAAGGIAVVKECYGH
ncbi:MAG: lytic transglycosylase domain-containing protein [Gammaproteobacteria bacterium]|nr:lytic transglycosylase domain-containing protein [Gammaproteobacteria bacterium]